MKCSRCHTDNDEGARFCEDCGARLELVCPRCGEPVAAGKKFCRSCGAALAVEPDSLPAPQAYRAQHLLRLLGVAEGTDGLAMLSPEAIKARTFETLCQLSLKGSQRRSLICAVEDLHWIDQTSQEYFAALVENLGGAAILIVSTYRPGYRPPWMDKSYTAQLFLHRLTARDSLSVVRSVLPEERLSDRVAQVVLEKAEGNPFFLEGLTRAVAEQTGRSGDLAVPDTIHGVLLARNDRRSPSGCSRRPRCSAVSSPCVS